MGWWGTDVFSGDTPLDILGDMEEFLGVEADIYPSSRMETEQQVRLATILSSLSPEEITTIIENRYHYDNTIAWQVLSLLWMACGAPIPDEIRNKMRQAFQEDEWAEEDAERQESMDRALATLDTYADEPTLVPSVTLGEAFLNHGYKT